MNRIEIAKATFTRVVGRGGLLTRKYSPEILIATGIVGIVASTVMACKATLKVEEVLEQSQEKFNMIESVHMDDSLLPDGYSEEAYKKDRALIHIQTGISLVKLYAPAVTLGTASICCILGAHNIMKKRNVAMIAAYKAIDASFRDYRRRVVEEFGEDKDRQFHYGISKEAITEVEQDENGKPKKVKKIVETVDPTKVSQYARYFDETSSQWSKNSEYNMTFLTVQQNHANDILNVRGHLFLNEVYDMLGIKHSQAGAIVGWVLGDGDNYVDFGIYNVNNEAARNFVNGYERSILLDFNVDGIIYDLI